MIENHAEQYRSGVHRMSTGILCLHCRQYLLRCACRDPLPSEDGEHRLPESYLCRLLRDAHAQLGVSLVEGPKVNKAWLGGGW